MELLMKSQGTTSEREGKEAMRRTGSKSITRVSENVRL